MCKNKKRTDISDGDVWYTTNQFINSNGGKESKFLKVVITDYRFISTEG